jgi:hypothetical protein
MFFGIFQWTLCYPKHCVILNIMLSQIFPVDFHVDPLKFELALEYDFNFFLLFDHILYIIYNILYIKYSILYTIYNSQIQCFIPYYTYLPLYNIPLLQWKVDFLSQRSTSIFSIRFFLDNDYGTIISFKFVLLNISLNMNVLKIICAISKLAFKVLSLIRRCYK